MMQESMKDVLIIALALCLMAAITLPFAPVHYADEPDLPAIETVSGNGIAVVGGDVLVDINSADAELLESLPGVGSVVAQRIIDYREEHGSFGSVDDLLNVSGIGPATLEDIRPEAAALGK